MSESQSVSDNNVPSKHALEHKWTIYEQVSLVDSVDKKEAYLNSYENICTFGTVETFWLNWTKLPSVSDLFYDGVEKEIIRIDTTNDIKTEKRYHILGQAIFKDDILPQYEDPANEKGGHIQVSLSHEAHQQLGAFWETVVLSMIGETLEEGDEIVGARILDKSNPRKKFASYRVEIWFRDYENQKIKEELKTKIEDFLVKNSISKGELKIKEHTSTW
ncbi:hypothetical protein WA158_004490 [Blastocystis sp. Blastoise]